MPISLLILVPTPLTYTKNNSPKKNPEEPHIGSFFLLLFLLDLISCYIKPLSFYQLFCFLDKKQTTDEQFL